MSGLSVPASDRGCGGEAVKKCDHPELHIVGVGGSRITTLKCPTCGKTWAWNSMLGYYSSDFVGVYVKTPDGT